mmetsp:Transcript_58415/g.136737  ORF Transcript_58415/g.136737 Transcript_58415/m.136737 type:complete len:209 (-) Transcript_58415:385-1011(-)
MCHVVAEDGVAPGALGVHGRELAEGPGGLVGDHLALMTEAAVEVGHQGLLYRRISLRHQRLSGVSDKQAFCHRAFQAVPSHAGHDLVQSQPISLLQLVEQSQGMKLHHAVLRVHSLLNLIDPALDDVGHRRMQRHAAHQGRRRNEGILVYDGCLEISVDLRRHSRIQNAAQDSNGVGSEAVVLTVHVFDEAGHANEDLLVRRLQLLDD